MLLLFTLLLFIILLSRLVETSTKIPSTLIIILLSFITTYLFPDLINISKEEFNEILYLMLPVILLPDVLNLSIDDLKKHKKEIFYLAVVAVMVSIAIAVIVTPFLMPEYQFTIGMLIALFAMLMATDAITVASIMSKFKLPERLKIYAEYESLFNDVTALIIFYFIALPLISGGDVSLVSVNITLLKVLVLSVAIGIFTAYIGYILIKILKNPFDQFIIIYLVVIVSFLLAEHLHIAGILSIVASAMAFKYLVKKDIKDTITHDEQERDFYSSIIEMMQKVPALTKKEFRGYKKEAMFIGIFANAIVFIIVANIIDFDLLFIYYKEILIVFVLTTLLRMISMYVMTKAIDLPFRWARGLTYAGAKGALAVIMVHSLPQDFIYLELFEAVVIGIVLLTTFIYTIALMIHIAYFQKEYIIDAKQDKSGKSLESNYTKSLVDLLEKDATSHAYTKAFIDDILTKELARAQRYKIDLSMVSFKISGYDDKDRELIINRLGELINEKIRANDNFGQLDDDIFLIVTSNTSLSGAVILAEKILENFEELKIYADSLDVYFGITKAEDTDDTTSIYERLDDALERGENVTKEKIEIEI
jgi:CPA1 family monovalent cation:H+ antiporter